jgi:hypothetical protein
MVGAGSTYGGVVAGIKIKIAQTFGINQQVN